MTTLGIIVGAIALLYIHVAWTVAWLNRRQPNPQFEASRRRIRYMLRQILS